VILGQCIPTYRSGVLKCFDLAVSDFANPEEAMKCADQYIARQRKSWTPEMFQKFPDQLFEGTPAADLFWFTHHKGMGGTLHFLKGTMPLGGMPGNLSSYMYMYICIYRYILYI
jgi:hypothetical protein